MISEQEARERVLAAISCSKEESLPLLKSLGRFAAADVLATVPLPGFDNSMMDGYAVQSRALGFAKVVGEQPAGAQLDLVCGEGEAIRIFTGAPLPAGADAVVMQEDVERTGDSIRWQESLQAGENVRHRGADLCEGQMILKVGDKLTAGRIGVLASQGFTSVRVIKPPRVAVLSTGNELIAPGLPLSAGQIYNSNGFMLQALLMAQGIEDISSSHCQDDFDQTVQTLKQLLATHDVVLLSGGVSVGDHDQIKPALQALGIKPDLWRVNVKPGKPFLFAQHEGKLIFGLPGNPVSSYVTYQIFVKPALMKRMGARQVEPTRLRVVSAQSLHNDGNRPHYLRGILKEGAFRVQGLQESHALFALSQADALLRLEAGATVAAGEPVEVLI